MAVTPQWQCCSYITVTVWQYHQNDIIAVTSQWQCGNYITVRVWQLHHSGNCVKVTLWQLHHSNITVTVWQLHHSDADSYDLCGLPSKYSLACLKKTSIWAELRNIKKYQYCRKWLRSAVRSLCSVNSLPALVSRDVISTLLDGSMLKHNDEHYKQADRNGQTDRQKLQGTLPKRRANMNDMNCIVVTTCDTTCTWPASRAQCEMWSVWIYDYCWYHSEAASTLEAH